MHGGPGASPEIKLCLFPIKDNFTYLAYQVSLKTIDYFKIIGSVVLFCYVNPPNSKTKKQKYMKNFTESEWCQNYQIFSS